MNEAKRQKLKKSNRYKQVKHIACILTYLAQTDQNHSLWFAGLTDVQVKTESQFNSFGACLQQVCTVIGQVFYRFTLSTVIAPSLFPLAFHLSHEKRRSVEPFEYVLDLFSPLAAVSFVSDYFCWKASCDWVALLSLLMKSFRINTQGS